MDNMAFHCSHKTKDLIEGVLMSGYVDFILDILSPYGNMRSRKMFGGHGIYMNDHIVGIIVNDELYFKTDETNVADYQEAGSRPFTYDKDGKAVAMSYWLVPSELLEEQEDIKAWLEKAYEVSQRAQSRKKKEKVRF